MHPRPRTRWRDPPPPSPGGGRHRRRSPPPPSPRHQRRPPPQRRSPERPPPRRYEEIPSPIPIPIPDPPGDRRSRADILLEAGRLAAHYLVAQGVIPDHLLRAREDPNHVTVTTRKELPAPPPPPPPPPPPAPASYGRKRDDEEEDPRWRRAGEWGRAKVDDDRQSRRSGWDRRSHSFDDRRSKYDRRTRDSDEPKRPQPMSRSYSHNDRRSSGDGRLDPRRRSRSRSRSHSRTRTRSYHHGGSRRDSDGRPTSRDLDRTKLPDSAINPADGEMPRKPKVPSSVVVAEVNDSAHRPKAVEDGEMESEMVGLDHAQDVSEEEDGEFAEDVSEEDGEDASVEEEEEEEEEEEDGEFAAVGFNDEDGAEMDVTEHPLSNLDVHPSEFVDVDVHPSEVQVSRTVHMQSQLRNVEDEIKAVTAPMDASMAEPSADNDSSFQVRDEMEPPQSEVEAGVGHLDTDEQELPAWYGIFDLNVVETPEGCKMPEISGDSPADPVCNSVPDLVGQMNQQTGYGSSEIQGEDELAGANHPLEYGHDLRNYDLNNVTDEHAHDDTSNIQGQDEDAGDNHLLEDEHDLNKCDLNHEADAHPQDNHLLSNEDGMAENDLDSCRPSNEQMLPKKNADEQGHNDHQMENEKMLVHQGTSKQGLDIYHVSDESPESVPPPRPGGSDDTGSSMQPAVVVATATEPASECSASKALHQLVQQPTQKCKSPETAPPPRPSSNNDAGSSMLALSHVTVEQVVNKHQLEPEPMHLPMGVHDVDSYNLNSEQMLLNNGTNKHAEEDTCHLKDGETLLDQAVDVLARVHNMGSGRTVHVIDLENDYEQQPDTRDTGEFLESISDQETSSFVDNPHSNTQAASSSSITPNFGNRCTRRGSAISQVNPCDDDALYVAFDKMPLEVINVWDLPSSELGKSS